MTKEEAIAANTAKGYIHVAEFDGFDIWKKKSPLGSWTYYSDEFSQDQGAFVVWDTVNCTKVLEAIFNDVKTYTPHG